jgi:hypothetical protein
MSIKTQIDDDIKTRLLDARNLGDIVIFFGAGVSQEAGFPSWQELIQQLIEVVKKDATAKDSTLSGFKEIQSDWSLDVLDVIKNTRKPYFQDCFRKIFPQSKAKYPATKLGRQIALLNVKRFITLNYDLCFQSSLFDVGITDFQEMTRNSLDISQLNSISMPLICQIHGSAIESIDHIILTKSQYNDAYQTGSPLRQFLNHAFTKLTLIMIGYGFNDDWINDILQLSNAYSQTPHQNLRIAIRGYTKEEEASSEVFSNMAKNQWGIDILEYKIITNGTLKDHSDIERVISSIGDIIGRRLTDVYLVQPNQLETDIINK